jgi:hypothetical protein
VAVQPQQVLRDLGLLEGSGPVIAVTRSREATMMLLAEPIQPVS